MADFSVTLAIAIVDNLEQGIWVLGSSIRFPFNQGLNHAKNEAFMLLESAFAESEQAYSQETDWRLNSLRTIRRSD